MEIKTKPSIESTFKSYDNNLVSKFYNNQHLIDHIEKSYAEFLDQYLKEFFKENEKILMLSQQNKITNKITDYYLNLGKYNLELTHYKGTDRTKKTIDSSVAMKYNLTRELNLNLQMYLSSKVRDSEEQEEVHTRKKIKYQLGKIPLLINSRFDPYAQRGPLCPYYFIINGSSRLLYHLLEPNNSLKMIRSDENTIQIRSSKDKFYNSQAITGYYTNDDISLNIPGISNSRFNIFLFLRILEVPIEDLLSLASGNIDAPEIINLAYQYYSKPISEIYKEYLTLAKLNIDQEDPELKQKIYNHIKKNVLPNELPIEYSNLIELKKAQLIDLLKELIYYKSKPEKIPYIDSLANKKLHSIKDHFIKVFQKGFKQIISKGKLIILRDLGLIKKTKSLSHLVRSDIIKKSFRKYLTQGSGTNSITVPQSEHLSYTNKTSIISTQRKIVSSLNKTLTHEKYRCVNPSKAGRICIVQTPHSRSVGLVEYLSLGSICSKEVPFSQISSYIGTINSIDTGSTGKLYINKKLIGYIYEDVNKLKEKLVKLKRKVNLSVVLKQSDLHLDTSEGRILKPFYVVNKEEPLIFKLTQEQFSQLNINQLVLKGYVTYLDFNEELSYKIAPTINDITKETQILQVNPAVHLSYGGSSLPLVTTNAAHRASLSLRLIDQAIGGKLDKSQFKFNELKVQYLINSNPSILRTEFDNHLQESIGQNLILAFMHGQNEEDSVVVNKSAIERGLLNSVMWKRMFKQIKKDENNTFNYEINDKVDLPIKTLDQDHLPQVGSIVNEDTILVLDEGNLSRPAKLVSPHTNYYINQVAIDTPVEDASILEFKFSKLRKVGEGDKIGTRYGLKGVLSKPKSELDLVIPENGVYPTIMISNHVINSRMIIGPLLEQYITKAAVLEGKPKVTPVFVDENTVKDLIAESRNVLLKHGLDPMGYENLFDVSTNTMKRISMGPTKTQLLEHWARDKFYTRAHKGGLNILTRQPGEGRSSKGGLKFSEMESNAALEHTAAEFIKDRLGVDEIKVKICNCGYIWDKNKEDLYCPVCKKESTTTTVSLPYAFVILTKILKAGHINTKFHLKKDPTKDTEEILDTEELDEDIVEEPELNQE